MTTNDTNKNASPNNTRIVSQAMELLGLLEDARMRIALLERKIRTERSFSPEDLEQIELAAADCEIAADDFSHLANTYLPIHRES